ncbi:hypothetical protein LPJ66_007398, partial [Kickxella alabastrina]
QQQQTADEYEGFDNVDDSTRNEYVQQFRLGPSLQSGSTTPAVTMDGYFVPQKVEDTAPTADTSEVRPRPRHRLVQRTWMEEALIKARRVSTIDENAEESILEGLAQAIARKPSPMQAPSIPAASSDVPKSPSPPGGGDLAQFMLGSGASNSANAAAAAPLPRVAHRGQALLAAVGGARNVAHRQASNEGMWARGRIDLTMLSEEPLEILASERPEGIPGALPDRSHAVSPRGYYRARDPAAPNRKLPAERQIRDQVLSSSISPARASLLRAVGRRQSVRLQPGKGQIVVADMEMGTRTTSVDGGNTGIPVPAAMGPDSMTRAKRATSLPERMQVPETKEVSYRDLQLKAARPVELKRARKSRARMVHRAERMVLGGSKPSNARSDDTHESLPSHSHNRTGSRPDIDQQLIKVELPPPVPLRVRREQVRIVPEPLIIVRQLAKHQQSIGRPTQQVLLRQSLQGRTEGAGMGSDEQKLLRVHNQLLGAQAVLSRHNSLMRNAVSSKPESGRSTPSGGSATAAGKELSLKASVQAMVVPPLVRNTVRKEALEIVMLDNALDDRMEDTEKQLIEEAKIRRRRDRRENVQDNVADTEDSEASLVKPWRNARRRSTLRKKERAQQNQQQQQHTSQLQSTTAVSATSTASEPTLPRSVLPRGRRLLLHGPAFRIYSGIRARPDTYLFLFTDMMVVTTRFSPASSFVGVDQMSMAFMAPPSSDPSSIPADSRFKFHIAIPLARSTTALKTMREGGSKRPGEDDDGEERRLVRQEERIRRACHAFEKNTSEAVVYLINRDIIDPVPDTVAGFLYRCTALSRRQLGSFLGTGILGENLHENPTTDEIEQEKLFHRQIWISFLDRCNIVGVPIDEALRSVMFYVRLPNNPLSISVLLEIAALQWFAKNIEHGQSGKVYVPDSQDMAIKLAFAIITLNTGLHNPLLRGETQPEVAYRDLLLKFRASVVDDPAVAGKRKGNVLRKRDQPRVVTIMEVPTERLKAIYERVAANRLVTCSDARPSAPEFDVDWIRDAGDINALPLTDDQVEQEIEEIYCDPGFRDGVLFNASSDRLPAKFNIEPPAWLRVTIRIPEPDSKLSIRIRVRSMPADPAPSAAGAGQSDVVNIFPNNWLTFRTSNTASFIIKPQQVGHFTLQFISEGSHARYYHPIPSRTMVVEGVFMRQTVQLSWKRSDEQGNRARHMFGMDSQPTKSRWVHCLEAALNNSSDVTQDEILSRVDNATRSLTALAPQPPVAGSEQPKPPGDRADGATLSRGTVTAATGTSAEQSISLLQLLDALHH